MENSSVDGNAKDAYPNDVDQDEDNLAQGLNEKLNAQQTSLVVTHKHVLVECDVFALTFRMVIYLQIVPKSGRYTATHVIT